MNMRDSGKTIRGMGMESIISQIIVFMKETGKMERNQAKDLITTPMVTIIQATFSMG